MQTQMLMQALVTRMPVLLMRMQQLIIMQMRIRKMTLNQKVREEETLVLVLEPVPVKAELVAHPLLEVIH